MSYGIFNHRHPARHHKVPAVIPGTAEGSVHLRRLFDTLRDRVSGTISGDMVNPTAPEVLSI